MFAYGQTGSGKTHTMGGLLRRVASDLYGDGGEARGGKVSFSYFEVLGGAVQVVNFIPDLSGLYIG